MFSRTVAIFSLIAIAGPGALVSADQAATLDPSVRVYFEQHCLKCHGPDKQKGDFRIDALSPKVGFENTPQWLEVMSRITNGEMPPKKQQVRPTAEQSAAVVEWLSAEL